MAWKLSEKPKTVQATASLIREFVDMEKVPGDRPFSERRVAIYDRILDAGQFRSVTWASAWCDETACQYRANGKHTAIMLGRRAKIPEFFVTLERYRCDHLIDLASLYSTFDSRAGMRTSMDINMSFAQTIPELRDIPARVINLSVASIAHQKWGEIDVKKITPAERAEELVDNTDFVIWLHGMSIGTGGGSKCLHLTRAPVVSAMLAMYRRSKSGAGEFWSLVRDESHPDRDDASRVLARFLLRSSLSMRAQEKVRDMVDARQMYVRCIHGWNAWRKGQTTVLKYQPSAPIPVVSK